MYKKTIKRKEQNPDYQIKFTGDKAFKDLCKSNRGFLNNLVSRAFNLDYSEVAQGELIDAETESIFYEGKKMIGDLILRIRRNFYINIEMNCYYNKTLETKNQDYIYRIILSKKKEGEKYEQIIVYQLNINDCVTPYDDNVINEYCMMNKETGKVLDYYPKVINVSLDNLRKNSYNNCNDDVLARQLAMLNSESISLTKELAGDNETLRKAAKFMEEYSNDLENLMYVDIKEEEKLIHNSEISEAYEDGKLQGEQRGLKLGEQRGLKLGEQRGLKLGEQRGVKKGELNSKKELIKNSLELGLELDKIAKIVSMPVDEVLKIKESLNN